MVISKSLSFKISRTVDQSKSKIILHDPCNLILNIPCICRRPNKRNLKIEICFQHAIKQCRKRRKCWSPAFSPFPTMFSKVFYLRVVKTRNCLVKRKKTSDAVFIQLLFILFMFVFNSPFNINIAYT